MAQQSGLNIYHNSPFPDGISLDGVHLSRDGKRYAYSGQMGNLITENVPENNQFEINGMSYRVLLQEGTVLLVKIESSRILGGLFQSDKITSAGIDLDGEMFSSSARRFGLFPGADALTITIGDDPTQEETAFEIAGDEEEDDDLDEEQEEEDEDYNDEQEDDYLAGEEEEDQFNEEYETVSINSIYSSSSVRKLTVLDGDDQIELKLGDENSVGLCGEANSAVVLHENHVIADNFDGTITLPKNRQIELDIYTEGHVTGQVNSYGKIDAASGAVDLDVFGPIAIQAESHDGNVEIFGMIKDESGLWLPPSKTYSGVLSINSLDDLTVRYHE